MQIKAHHRREKQQCWVTLSVHQCVLCACPACANVPPLILFVTGQRGGNTDPLACAARFNRFPFRPLWSWTVSAPATWYSHGAKNVSQYLKHTCSLSNIGRGAVILKQTEGRIFLNVHFFLIALGLSLFLDSVSLAAWHNHLSWFYMMQLLFPLLITIIIWMIIMRQIQVWHVEMWNAENANAIWGLWKKMWHKMAKRSR